MSKGKSMTLVSLVMLSGAAFAAPPAFEDVDTNGDGQISRAEAATIEGLDWTSADANGDGNLSKEEYAAAASKM